MNSCLMSIVKNIYHPIYFRDNYISEFIVTTRQNLLFKDKMYVSSKLINIPQIIHYH